MGMGEGGKEMGEGGMEMGEGGRGGGVGEGREREGERRLYLEWIHVNVGPLYSPAQRHLDSDRAFTCPLTCS